MTKPLKWHWQAGNLVKGNKTLTIAQAAESTDPEDTKSNDWDRGSNSLT